MMKPPSKQDRSQVHGSYVICGCCMETVEVEQCGEQVFMQCFNCQNIRDVEEKDIIKIYRTRIENKG